MQDKIIQFQGNYRFLSNFWSEDNLLSFEGIVYHSVESAYQAMKSNSRSHRIKCAEATPGQAKRLGQRVQLRKDWESVKVNVMRHFVHLKFSSNPFLAERLVNTDPVALEEGNTWGDRFWGIYYPSGTVGSGGGQGVNQLGQILMTERLRLTDAHDNPEAYYWKKF